MRHRLASVLALSLLLAAVVHAGPPAITPADDEAVRDAAARDAAVLRLQANAPDGAERVFGGGETLALRGLLLAPSLTTDLALRNLAAGGIRCTLALAGVDGRPLAPTIELTLGAGETRPDLDVFAPAATSPLGLAQAEIVISCDGEFSAYAVVVDRDNGWLDRVAPEPAAAALAAAPAGTAPACPAGARCFDAVGTVHIPQPPPGNPVGRVSFPAPAGIAKRLRLTLDVTVGPWYPQSPSGKHLLYWFVVSKNIDMPGMLYFQGPGKNQAFARHGMGLKHPDKLKIIKPFSAIVGTTYHIDNDYNMAGRAYTVKISNAETGSLRLNLRGVPNVTSYTVKPGSTFLVDMGFPPPTVNPTEVPSYGWKYANLHLEAYLQ